MEPHVHGPPGTEMLAYIHRPPGTEMLAHHPRRPKGSPFRCTHCHCYTHGIMKGKNTCRWLTLSSTELCGRSCLGDHCKIHLARLRKGSGTKPCIKCGKGVLNRFSLCQGCGYVNENVKAWWRKKAALEKEFRRLALIDAF